MYIYIYTYSIVYRSNVLALYSFYPPEPKCITQNKTQRSQINFAKEPNLAPEPRVDNPDVQYIKPENAFSIKILSHCKAPMPAIHPTHPKQLQMRN